MFRHFFGIGIDEYRHWDMQRFALHKDYILKTTKPVQPEGGGR